MRKWDVYMSLQETSPKDACWIIQVMWQHAPTTFDEKLCNLNINFLLIKWLEIEHNFRSFGRWINDIKDT